MCVFLLDNDRVAILTGVLDEMIQQARLSGSGFP